MNLSYNLYLWSSYVLQYHCMQQRYLMTCNRSALFLFLIIISAQIYDFFTYDARTAKTGVAFRRPIEK